MAEKKEFKIGDVVELKSGGAEMTIQKITQSSQGETAFCVWQDDKNKDFSKSYPTAVLQHVDDSIDMGLF